MDATHKTICDATREPMDKDLEVLEQEVNILENTENRKQASLPTAGK